ncbi:MAG TPA: carboxypeptidase-like regulatory domain-containing protein [Bryobacteraceae bacterium]|jgi:hypothetical protein
MLRSLLHISVVVCLVAFFSANSFSQVSTATLVGAVRDSSGATIPGATVTAKNLATGLARNATTDSAGNYVITTLQAGHYSVTAGFSGFKTATVGDFELQVAQQATLNFSLEVGQITQETTVTAAAPLLNAVNSEVGQVVDTQTVESMPLNGRSFWQLTQLTPGVAYIPGGQNVRSGGTSIRASIVNVNVNGQAPTWTGWSLDGANITEFQLGGTIIQPNVDALQEFRVESANMDAQYGHTPSMVNATLKGGTNQYHGVVYEFLRNSALDARNFFYQPPPGSSLAKEPLRRNQPGATFGGPIKKDKAFFFVDFESTQLSQGQDANDVVASVAERSGNFSDILPKTIKDPLTGQPFPGNIIPSTRLAPQSQYLLQYMPAPNLVQGSTFRWAGTSPLGQQLYKADARFDQQFTANDRLMARYSIADNNESDPNPFPAIGQFALHSRGQSAVASETHVFSPRWLNEFRVAYYRSYFLFGPALGGTDVNQAAGIQGFEDTSSLKSFPQISISGYTAFTGSPSDQRPKQNRIRDWQFHDGASFSTGKHDIKFGADLMHITNAFISGAQAMGISSFVGTYSGNGMADFLLGYPDNVQRSDAISLWGANGSFWGFYFQDNYRITQNLTLNLGGRWEINPFYNGVRGQITAFDFQTGKLIIPSGFSQTAQPLTTSLYPLFQDRIELTNSLGLPQSIRPTDYLDWAPRVGLAWRPFGSNNWVVRSGYGIFYAYPDTNLENNTVQTVPFVQSEQVFNDRPPTVPSLTFGNFFQGQPIVTANPNPGQVCSFGFAANSCSTPSITGGLVHLRNTYVQEWNFSVQRQISRNLSLDVAYVGNKSTRTQQFIPRNDPLPGPGAIQNRRPYEQWGTIRSVEYGGAANYNALQTKFEARDLHGLSTLVSYTFNKCLDNGSAEGSAPTSLLIPINRAVCDFSVPHNFVASFTYALPFGKNRSHLGHLPGAGDALLGGWNVSGIATLQSGLPFTPVISVDQANTGVGSQRPELVGQPSVPGSVSCWFYVAANPSCAGLGGATAFALPAQYTYGNSGRNILRADHLYQFDFTVGKNFVFTETKYLEFRTEFFNIFNHPTFAGPATAVDTSSGGQISSTLNAGRTIELALKLFF